MTSLPDLIRQLREAMAKATPGPWSYIDAKTLIHLETGPDCAAGAGIPIASFAKKNLRDVDLIYVMHSAIPILIAAIDKIGEDITHCESIKLQAHDRISKADDRARKYGCERDDLCAKLHDTGLMLKMVEGELDDTRAQLAKSQEECAAIVNSTLKELDEARAKLAEAEKELAATWANINETLSLRERLKDSEEERDAALAQRDQLARDAEGARGRKVVLPLPMRLTGPNYQPISGRWVDLDDMIRALNAAGVAHE